MTVAPGPRSAAAPAGAPCPASIPAWRRMAGILLLAAYALPLFTPPDALPLLLDGPSTSFIQHLFPGVPAWWVGGRLLCLFTGAWLIAVGAPRGTPLLRLDAEPIAAPGTVRLIATITLAGALLYLAWQAATLSRATQLGFLLAAPLPALVLASPSAWRRAGAVLRGIPWVLPIPLLWIAALAPAVWRSTWIANVVDTLGPFTVLERSIADPQLNLLIGDIHSRVSGLFLVSQGAGLSTLFGNLPAMEIVQLCNVLWVVAGGITVAGIALRLFDRGTAPVLAAALLFAPYSVASTLFLAPMALGLFLPMLAVLLLALVVTRRSSAALVGLGTVAGLQVTNPTLTLLIGLLFAAGFVAAWKRPRLPALATIAALLVFVATALPGAPRALRISELAAAYTKSQAPWALVEALYLGQVDPELVKFAEDEAPTTRLDAPLGSLLAPFATPRTAMRAWGDGLFDPLTSILVAIGIAICLRRRDGAAIALLALLAAALLPSFTSSYDRASLTRSSGLTAPLMLLAGVGFLRLRQVYLERLPDTAAAALVALSIAAGGWTLTQYVQPRILARSATAIAMEAAYGGGPGQDVILVPSWWDAQGSTIFARALPEPPLDTLRYQGPSSLQHDDGTPLAQRLFWSPALEEQRSVGRDLCRIWPGTRIFTLFDAAGLSSAFVAIPGHGRWTPNLPRQRWQESPCRQSLLTSRSAARRAITHARHHLAQGRPQPAIDLLRDAAARSITQVPLFDLLARTLLRYGTRPEHRHEAIFWAQRAVRISNSCPNGPVATLVRAYQSDGDRLAARQARARARRARHTLCRGLPHDHPWRTP